jgi:hypothetical protein
VHYAYDTVALAKGTGNAMVKAGGKNWFFLTADYAFGHALERDTEAWSRPTAAPCWAVRHPLNASGLLVVPAAGAGLEGQDPRPGQRRRRHHQRDQGRPRSSASPRRP